jgi:fluoroquinolone transport system permease protein
MRTVACLKNDIRLQFRYRFYYIYLVVTIIYVAVLSEESRSTLLPVIILTDPGLIGFLFVGGIIFLERGEQTLQALFITPLRLHEYILAKVLSLTVLAVIATLVIAIAVTGLSFNIPLLVLSVSLTSFVFTFIGIISVSRFSTISEYVVFAGFGVNILLLLPLLEYFGLVTTPLFYVFPTRAALLLLQGSFNDRLLSTGELIYGILSLSVWTFVTYFWAYRWFIRHFITETRNVS